MCSQSSAQQRTDDSCSFNIHAHKYMSKHDRRRSPDQITNNALDNNSLYGLYDD